MPISFACPNCQSTLRVADAHAGKKVRCGKCQAVVDAPILAVPLEVPTEAPVIITPLDESTAVTATAPAPLLLPNSPDEVILTPKQLKPGNDEILSPKLLEPGRPEKRRRRAASGPHREASSPRRDKTEPPKRGMSPLVRFALGAILLVAGGAVAGVYFLSDSRRPDSFAQDTKKFEEKKFENIPKIEKKFEEKKVEEKKVEEKKVEEKKVEEKKVEPVFREVKRADSPLKEVKSSSLPPVSLALAKHRLDPDDKQFKKRTWPLTQTSSRQYGRFQDDLLTLDEVLALQKHLVKGTAKKSNPNVSTLWDHLKTEYQKQNYRTIGHATGDTFLDSPRQVVFPARSDGFLAGCYCSSPKDGGIQCFQAIYKSAKGHVFNTTIGDPDQRCALILARPGYAVGDIRASVSESQRLEGFAFRFMKINGMKLDPRDYYDSPWIGGHGVQLQRFQSEDGFIMGVRMIDTVKNNQSNLSQLAVLVVKANATPEEPAPQPANLPNCQVADLVAGKGDVAVPGRTLKVKCVGTLKDGRKFDDRTFVLVLGAREVVEGLEIGVEGMRVGGTRRVVVPPHLGYGSEGWLQAVPPNAELTYEVQLLNLR
jgi:predicted Zn finger-like uncharacterized protein